MLTDFSSNLSVLLSAFSTLVLWPVFTFSMGIIAVYITKDENTEYENKKIHSFTFLRFDSFRETWIGITCIELVLADDWALETDDNPVLDEFIDDKLGVLDVDNEDSSVEIDVARVVGLTGWEVVGG